MKKIQHKKNAKKIAVEKVPTYIIGLDEILGGGLPEGKTTVVYGGAGTGKTVMGLEFIYKGALAGEPGIFVCFEEKPEQLRKNALTLGWNIKDMEKRNLLFLYDGEIKPDVLVSGQFSLKGLLAAVAGKAREIKARRIVIDALDVILRFFDTPQKIRSEMHLINNWLNSESITVLMTVRPTKRHDGLVFEEFFESMSDCVIILDSRISEQVTTRRVRVAKYRGSDFEKNEYPYVITSSGIKVTPITRVGLMHKPLGQKISTGIKEFDRILNGGYSKGSCILIAGQPGSGKTILSCSFIESACRRKEKILYIGFEESEAAVIHNVKSAGISILPYFKSECLRFITNYPEAMGAEEHYIRAIENIDGFKPAHVIVDSISACPRMGGKQAAFEYLMRLLNYCKEKGITIIMINQLSGKHDFLEISGNSISSMIDTVIFMDYFEKQGETSRFIHILKSRGSGHSNRKHEFQITDNGIKFLD
ncbi:MAG: circadian clock protein KaiC [Bacteroidales bacterium]